MTEQVEIKSEWRRLREFLIPDPLATVDTTNGVPIESVKSSSPLRLLTILTLTVFIVELAIMVGIEFAVDPESSVLFQVVEAIFDATMLTIIVFPMLYRYSFRPLVLYITDHQRIEKALKESSALLENTFASMNDLVLVIGKPDQRVITCNRAAKTVLGYEQDELVGEKLGRLYFDQTQYHAFSQRMADVFPNERFFQEEVALCHRNGRSLSAELTVTEIKNDAGETTSQVVVIRDLTRRKEDEAQLERQNQELKILSQLGQTVVSSLELDSIFDQVIGRVMPLLQAECLSIALRQNSELVYVANGGLDSEAMINRRASTREGVIGEVMHTGKPVFVTASDEPSDPILASLDQICYCEPRTLMAVPLKVENEIIGVMQAAHRETTAFTNDGLRILQAAADWAAIAISHARQHEEIQRRLKEAATLAAINQSLNETLDLDNILQLIADSTPKLIHNVDRVVIHLLNTAEKLLYPAIWSGQADMESPALYMNANEGVAGQALKIGKLINVPDVTQDPHYLPFTPSNQIKSLMVAPLQSGQSQLGTLSVHNNLQENAFSPTDEQLLMRLADSAAITIATADLYQAERSQRQFAELLAAAAAALSTSLQLNEILQTILDQTLRIVTGCEKAAIFLLKEGKVFLSRSTDEEELPERLPEALHRIFVRQDFGNLPHPALIAATGKPILIAETENEPSWPNETGADWLKSFVAAPLRVRSKITGFLNVHSTRLGAFDKKTIQQVEALAAHASLAIQNATLYNDLKAALQKEQGTRAQLVQAQKLSAMGRMVASVAHELNNPLQTIKNCLFLTQQDVNETAETNTYLEMALSETQRLSNLVLHLREVYRPGGSGPRKPVSVSQLLSQIYQVLKPHLRQKAIKWEQELEAEDVTVNADANQLKQVLLNICLNGIEAMQPNGGTLSLHLFVDTTTAETGLAIHDTGSGIPNENLPQLFEPFFTTKETGTGLGLAICYDIIQTHGGRIDVKSPPGEGATFTIWLPVVTATDVVGTRET